MTANEIPSRRRLPLLDASSSNPLEASIARLRAEELALERLAVAELELRAAALWGERNYAAAIEERRAAAAARLRVAELEESGSE